ncbi:MAG: hypothetical protein OXL96_05965 [Candidatus Poribacteria bacterium]|nr:hypothetical protein [Candidatus Poribacteria bacterium]
MNGIKMLAILLLIFPIACTPSTLEPEPPAVDLTGTWEVTLELQGSTGGPFTWLLTQKDSFVYINELGASIDSCKRNELVSEVSGNQWKASFSYDPLDCPPDTPLSGEFSFDVLVTGLVFRGPLTFIDTSQPAFPETHEGRIIGVRQ